MNWIVFAGILMLAAFAVSIILYLLSRLIKYPKLELWAKGELMEVMVTAAIVGVIIGLLTLLNVIGCGIYYMSQSPAYTPDSAYLEEQCRSAGINPANAAVIMLHDNVLALQRAWYAISWEISFWSNLFVNIKIVVPGGAKFDFNKYLAPFTVPFEFASSLFGDLIFYSFLSIEMIKFFDYFSVFALPVGIVLRAFPGSRGMGALLIAIGVGFAYIYPITLIYLQYALGGSVIQRAVVLAEEVQKTEIFDKSYLDSMCLDSVSEVMGMSELVRSYVDSGAIENSRSKIEGVMNSIITLFLIQLIALIFAVTFTRSFSMLLGTDLKEIGAGIFKFI